MGASCPDHNVEIWRGQSQLIVGSHQKSVFAGQKDGLSLLMMAPYLGLWNSEGQPRVLRACEGSSWRCGELLQEGARGMFQSLVPASSGRLRDPVRCRVLNLGLLHTKSTPSLLCCRSSPVPVDSFPSSEFQIVPNLSGAGGLARVRACGHPLRLRPCPEAWASVGCRGEGSVLTSFDCTGIRPHGSGTCLQGPSSLFGGPPFLPGPLAGTRRLD